MDGVFLPAEAGVDFCDVERQREMRCGQQRREMGGCCSEDDFARHVFFGLAAARTKTQAQVGKAVFCQHISDGIMGAAQGANANCAEFKQARLQQSCMKRGAQGCDIRTGAKVGRIFDGQVGPGSCPLLCLTG